MKYTMVKQFSNGMVDNFFTFLFKWVDCAKMFLEFVWSFIEIWLAFFFIFYNVYMYVYYLFLFLIDRGSESSASYLRFGSGYSKASYIPKIEIPSVSNIVPPMYRVAAKSGTAVNAFKAKTTEAAGEVLTSLRSTASYGMKKSLIRRFLSSCFNFFKTLGKIFTWPFKWLVLRFDRGVELHNSRTAASGETKSLIDEYIKEYEHKKK